ncbi:relA-associated inhibitor [Synchiropus splendidus]|uniref:relA-associated inhibitor n=1 Tax=Synchiropus splendidus TaxID=270530 RepID=UPI00237DADEB|nr:relA-associated inhibitor [Synchiropus splendidus]
MSFGSSMFQALNDDLNASLAMADEVSKEFDSLRIEATPSTPDNTEQFFPVRERQRSDSPSSAELCKTPTSSVPFSPSSSSHSSDSTRSPSPKLPNIVRTGSGSHSPHQLSPNQSPVSPRRNSPTRYNRSPRGSLSYMDRSPTRSPTTPTFDLPSRSGSYHGAPNLLSPYDSSTMGRRSPRRDRSPSPLSFNSSTVPRNFSGFRQQDEGAQQQPRKPPSKWNETDLDMSYERKPHHTYDKKTWMRATVSNSNWKESNLDGPPPAPSPKKVPRSPQFPRSSLPRNARISVPPDVSSPSHSPYLAQPIISRISIPPANSQTRQRRPIPLSVIMRLQNPHWGAMSPQKYQPAASIHREYFHPPHHPAELRQPAVYIDALNPGDIDAELERIDYTAHLPAISEKRSIPEGGGAPVAPRPLSPTRLQPVVAPEAQAEEIPNIEEVLRIRAEIPRALKRRGSVDHSLPLKPASHYEPNQYKNLINKLFHRKEYRHKGEPGSETSSSSDEDPALPPPVAATRTPTTVPHDRNYHSILRRSSKEHKSSGRRARLSPLVLVLDGALVGELETVQRAVQEMQDPSQPNDEGITALHNAICGGHYNVVDFLVRAGANVSAPDSHGWTPLHCAASCNDRPLCEFLVRSGAAVMAMTESDGATAAQKCDPYAIGFEECETFLQGMEEAMGLENSGVLYALWSYPAQAPDELSFKDGDMLTILQKPEGSDWWWASLCGREGFVPNNYFGLFPKVRPKTLS